MLSPTSQFPLCNLPTEFPLSLLLWETPPHSCLSARAFPCAGESSLYRTKGHPLPLMPEKAILCYICSRSHGSLPVYSLVGGLVPGNSLGVWLVDIIVLLMVAIPLSSFSPSPNSSTGVPVLSLMVGHEHLSIRISIGQLACFLIEVRTTSTGMAPPTMAGALPGQSLFNKMPSRSVDSLVLLRHFLSLLPLGQL